MNQESESANTKKNPRLQLSGMVALAILIIIFSIAGVGCRPPGATQAPPYPPSGTPTIDDPLTHNNSHEWEEKQLTKGGRCLFSSNTYLATESVLPNKRYHYHACAAKKTNYSNFTFGVEMTFKTYGDNDANAIGGLIFRANSKAVQFYGFSISPQGNYQLFVSFGPDTNTPDQDLAHGSAQSFITGPNQHNTIGAIVKGNEIWLYINNQYVAHVQDEHRTSGQVGVLVGGTNHVTEVVYTKAKVWQIA